jgi:hypothetical protein
MTEQRRRSTGRTLVFSFGAATSFVIAVTLASCGGTASTADESLPASEAAAGSGSYVVWRTSARAAQRIPHWPLTACRNIKVMEQTATFILDISV